MEVVGLDGQSADAHRDDGQRGLSSADAGHGLTRTNTELKIKSVFVCVGLWRVKRSPGKSILIRKLNFAIPEIKDKSPRYLHRLS